MFDFPAAAHRALGDLYFEKKDRHLAYIVREDSTGSGTPRELVVLDGRKSPSCDQIVGYDPLKFRKDGTLEFLAVRSSLEDDRMDSALYRVKHGGDSLGHSSVCPAVI